LGAKWYFGLPSEKPDERFENCGTYVNRYY